MVLNPGADLPEESSSSFGELLCWRTELVRLPWVGGHWQPLLARSCGKWQSQFRASRSYPDRQGKTAFNSSHWRSLPLEDLRICPGHLLEAVRAVKPGSEGSLIPSLGIRASPPPGESKSFPSRRQDTWGAFFELPGTRVPIGSHRAVRADLCCPEESSESHF